MPGPFKFSIIDETFTQLYAILTLTRLMTLLTGVNPGGMGGGGMYPPTFLGGGGGGWPVQISPPPRFLKKR